MIGWRSDCPISYSNSRQIIIFDNKEYRKLILVDNNLKIDAYFWFKDILDLFNILKK